eukprot:scaffold4.g4716.t1
MTHFRSDGDLAGGGFYADTVAKAHALPPERRPPEVAAFLQAHALLEQADAVLPEAPPPATMHSPPLMSDCFGASPASEQAILAAGLDRVPGGNRELVLEDSSEDEQLLAAIKYLRASYTRVPGQPWPLNHPRLTNNQRFDSLISRLKIGVAFDIDPGRMARMEFSVMPKRVEELLCESGPGRAPTLVRDARMATKLLLLADRELLDQKPSFARKVLDALHRSLNDPGASAAISAQLEAMQRGAVPAGEGIGSEGASSAGSNAAPAQPSSPPPPDGASLAQLRSLCLAMKLQAWPTYAWSVPAAQELAEREPGHLRNLVRLGDRLDDMGQAKAYAAEAQGLHPAQSEDCVKTLLAALHTWKGALAGARETGWVQALREVRAEAHGLRPVLKVLMDRNPQAWDMAAGLGVEAPESLRAVLRQMRASWSAFDQRAAEKDVCTACGAKSLSLKVCSRCRSAFYCSVECQRHAWAAGHKQECKAAQARRGGQTEQQAGGSRRRARG